eukprot:2661917-Rhodomonas_salina.1
MAVTYMHDVRITSVVRLKGFPHMDLECAASASIRLSLVASYARSVPASLRSILVGRQQQRPAQYWPRRQVAAYRTSVPDIAQQTRREIAEPTCLPSAPLLSYDPRPGSTIHYLSTGHRVTA